MDTATITAPEEKLFDSALEPLPFYGPNDPFSTFYDAAIEINGETYATQEHYYQASKFDPDEHPTIRAAIIYAPTPEEAKERARTYINYWREGWQDMKVEVFYRTAKAKYEQHPELAKMLLDTGERELVENSDSDDFWGRSKTIPLGLNNNGRVLMRIRRELREARKHEPGFAL